MKYDHVNYQNCIVLLMSLAGGGKRTIGTALARAANFRFVNHYTTWIDPILNLLGMEHALWWELEENALKKLNEARDVILSTIADVCPKKSNFIITYEMFEEDPFHKEFYDKILQVVDKRNSHFLPVRLICDENELITRVQAADKKKYYRTHDAEEIRTKVTSKDIFHSGHTNEITINNTDKTPDQVVKIILEQLNKLCHFNPPVSATE